jgi:hypothetical protein
MPENMPPTAPPPVPPEPAGEAASTPFDIGEEFGTARKNLPPLKIVLIAVAGIAIIAAIVGLIQKPRQTASGSLSDIVSVAIPDQNMVMVAINVSIQNHDKQRYVVRGIKADMEGNNTHYSDDAASAVDFERYFQAFPGLKQHALEPLKLESKIEPGAELKGTVIVSFPVTQDVFQANKSLTLTITPARQSIPLVLGK